MNKVKIGDPVKASTINGIISAITNHNNIPNQHAGNSSITNYSNGIERQQFDVKNTVAEVFGDDPYIRIIFSGGVYVWRNKLMVAEDVDIVVRENQYLILIHDTGDITIGTGELIDPRLTILGKIERLETGFLTYNAYTHTPIPTGAGDFSFYPNIVQTFTGVGEDKVYTYWVQLSGGLINYSGSFLALVEDPEEPEIIYTYDDKGVPTSSTISNPEASRVQKIEEGDIIILKTKFDVTGISYNVIISKELPYPTTIATYDPTLI